MKGQKNWRTILAQHDELPKQPLLELTGDGRLLIENHRGICVYGKERICIRVQYGMIEINGEQMELAMISCQKLIVKGKINSVSLHRRR